MSDCEGESGRQSMIACGRKTKWVLDYLKGMMRIFTAPITHLPCDNWHCTPSLSWHKKAITTLLGIKLWLQLYFHKPALVMFLWTRATLQTILQLITWAHCLSVSTLIMWSGFDTEKWQRCVTVEIFTFVWLRGEAVWCIWLETQEKVENFSETAKASSI